MASLRASVTGGMAGRLRGTGTTSSASLWNRLQAAGRWMISPIQERVMNPITADHGAGGKAIKAKVCSRIASTYQRPACQVRLALPASVPAGVPLPPIPFSDLRDRSGKYHYDITDDGAGGLGKSIKPKCDRTASPYQHPSFQECNSVRVSVPASVPAGLPPISLSDHGLGGKRIKRKVCALTASPYRRAGCHKRLAVPASALAGAPLSFSDVMERTGNLPLSPESAPFFDVHFRLLERPLEDAFCLQLPTDLTLCQVMELIAGQIGVDDPTRIQIRPQNTNHGPGTVPFEYRAPLNLKSMLMSSFKKRAPHVLYFDVLEVQTVQVMYHSRMDEVSVHMISMWRDFTARNVLHAIKPQVSLTNPTAEIRLLQVSHGSSFRVYKPEEYVDFAAFTNQTPFTLHAEEVPEGQDCLINVRCISKSKDGTVKKMEDLILWMSKNENMTLKETKMALEDEFPEHLIMNSKFLYISPKGRHELRDSEVLCEVFRGCLSSAFLEYLQWEIVDSEESKTKRKREEGNELSMQKKTRPHMKAPEPAENKGGPAVAMRPSFRMCGPTEEEEEELERFFANTDDTMEGSGSGSATQIGPTEGRAEDSSGGFGSPVHVPTAFSEIPRDVMAEEKKDKGKSILYIC